MATRTFVVRSIAHYPVNHPMCDTDPTLRRVPGEVARGFCPARLLAGGVRRRRPWKDHRAGKDHRAPGAITVLGQVPLGVSPRPRRVQDRPALESWTTPCRSPPSRALRLKRLGRRLPTPRQCSSPVCEGGGEHATGLGNPRLHPHPASDLPDVSSSTRHLDERKTCGHPHWTVKTPEPG